MAKHTFKTPIQVGDLNNRITVDALELVSVSINFQPENKYTSVSCMLRHAKSGYIHMVTLGEHSGYSWDADNRPVHTGTKADGIWAALKAEFPTFEQRVLELLQEHLPEGTVS